MGTLPLLTRYETLYPNASQPLWQLSEDFGAVSILMTNVFILAPVLLLMRRWQLPFGSITMLLTSVEVLTAGLDSFAHTNGIVIAFITGLVVDGLIALLRPLSYPFLSLRIVAVVAPLVFWSLHFIANQLAVGIAWTPAIWAGIIVMTCLHGVGLSVLVAPPQGPLKRET